MNKLRRITVLALIAIISVSAAFAQGAPEAAAPAAQETAKEEAAEDKKIGEELESDRKYYTELLKEEDFIPTKDNKYNYNLSFYFLLAFHLYYISLSQIFQPFLLLV